MCKDGGCAPVLNRCANCQTKNQRREITVNETTVSLLAIFNATLS